MAMSNVRQGRMVLPWGLGLLPQQCWHRPPATAGLCQHQAAPGSGTLSKQGQVASGRAAPRTSVLLAASSDCGLKPDAR